MIRYMTETDIKQVYELECLCFSDPWSETMLLEGLGCKLDDFFILEKDGTIYGYSNLRVIGAEGEIQRIAVHPDCRGLGYGKKLMEQMGVSARERGILAMTLEVRAGNVAAINLYKSYGFEQEAVRRGYYRQPPEDGIIMWNHKV